MRRRWRMDLGWFAIFNTPSTILALLRDRSRAVFRATSPLPLVTFPGWCKLRTKVQGPKSKVGLWPLDFRFWTSLRVGSLTAAGLSGGNKRHGDNFQFSSRLVFALRAVGSGPEAALRRGRCYFYTGAGGKVLAAGGSQMASFTEADK
jgi:hypothetical protein